MGITPVCATDCEWREGELDENKTKNPDSGSMCAAYIGDCVVGEEVENLLKGKTRLSKVVYNAVKVFITAIDFWYKIARNFVIE